MQNSFQRIVTGLVFFILTLIVAITGYALFGWELSDAVYMTVITIFGVGYGEVKPLNTPSERIFTILVIFAGFISVAYIVGGFVQMMMEGEINRVLDIRRKTQDIENLSSHVIICGYGRIGQILARQLDAAKQPFIVVDNNLDRVTYAESSRYLAHLGNAADEEILQYVGIHRAKSLATVLPDDAMNVFITLTARGLNPDLMILARGEMPATEKKLQLAGANHVVLPATISAHRMTNLITQPNTIEFLDQNAERSHLNDLLAQIDVQIAELVIPRGSPLTGRTLSEVEGKGKGGFLVIAIRRADNTVVSPLSPSTILCSGDTLIILGHQDDLPQIARSYALKRNMRYRGAKT